MILSFSNKETQDFFTSGKIKKGVGWKKISKIAKRKLDMLHYADQLEDLKVTSSKPFGDS